MRVVVNRITRFFAISALAITALSFIFAIFLFFTGSHPAVVLMLPLLLLISIILAIPVIMQLKVKMPMESRRLFILLYAYFKPEFIVRFFNFLCILFPAILIIWSSFVIVSMMQIIN